MYPHSPDYVWFWVKALYNLIYMNVFVDTFVFIFYVEVSFIASKNKDLFINEKIRAKEVMVIGPNGEQLGVKPIGDALTLANMLDLIWF